MKKSYRSLILAAAAVLIVCGIIIDAIVITRQNENILSEEETQLHHLAESIDRNIDSYLDFRVDLVNRESDRYFVNQAKKQWLETGDPADLTSRLYSAILAESDIADDVIVVRDGKPVFSVGGDQTYSFDEYKSSDYLIPCRGQDGTIHILILSQADEDNIQIGLVIDVEEFYHSIISSDLASDKWVLLLDSQTQIMVHYQNSRVLTDSIDAVTGATCGPDGIEMIKQSQLEALEQTGEYEYWDSANKLEHTAYINVIPSFNTQNKYFAIGVAGEIDSQISIMRNTVIAHVIAIVLIMLGLTMLAWNFRRSARAEREQLRELELLREKNDAMKELQDKHDEMAHLDRLETIGTLTSSIAHEFNNVLTPVMAYSLLALEKLPEEENEVGDYVEEIYNAASRAKTIVSRLSDLSRKNSDKSFGPVNLKNLINKACSSVAPAKPENVELVLKLDDSCDADINANELQLHQMLINFMINAFQAMGDGAGVLTIESRIADGKAYITVSDNGPGIRREIQKKIFDPFFTTKGSGVGTGLGLAICKQAVEDHKGTISLESEEGKGCKFTVVLPK